MILALLAPCSTIWATGKLHAFKIYSLSLPPQQINNFDDIILHFSFSSDFLSNQMLLESEASCPLHDKKGAIIAVEIGHLFSFLYSK